MHAGVVYVAAAATRSGLRVGWRIHCCNDSGQEMRRGARPNERTFCTGVSMAADCGWVGTARWEKGKERRVCRYACVRVCVGGCFGCVPVSGRAGDASNERLSNRWVFSATETAGGLAEKREWTRRLQEWEFVLSSVLQQAREAA